MSARRFLGVVLVLSVASACAQQSRTNALKSIKPENGPDGFITATYTGGLVFRTVTARFQVDETAYVLVGHLGGDGAIRVIYPETPREYVRVRGNKSIRTASFTAQYDGAPYLYSFTTTPFRGASAMMDSYDGRGHGYIFMIASRSPLLYDQLSDGGEWDVVDVVDYTRSIDPRLAIRDFAYSLAGNVPFTLKFANSFTTQSFASFASTAWDCALFSSYGMYFGFWGSWAAPRLSSFSHASRYGGDPSCGGSRYGYYASYGRGFTYGVGAPYPGLPFPRVPRPTGPGPLTPKLTRPGYRPLSDHSPAVLVTRSRLDRRDESAVSQPRERDIDRRGRAGAVDESGSRPSRITTERSAPRASDDARASRPRETTQTETRARNTETSRPAVERAPAAERARPAEPARTQETPRASSPREVRTDPPKPDKPPGG